MKITTYSLDGSIKSEEVVKVNIPDYLKVFNGEYPILNVTDEEKHLINSKEDSFAKTLLLDRLKSVLEYDYRLYKESLKNDCSGCLLIGLCSDIREIEELLVQESIEPNPWYKKVRNAASKVEDVIEMENGIESMEDHRDDANYTFKLTLDILTLFEAISEYANKMYHFITENGGVDKFSFDIVRPIEGLYCKRKYLNLFKKSLFKFDEKNLTIDCSAFSDRLIKELCGSNGTSREAVYQIMNEIESLTGKSSITPDNQVFCFTTNTPPKTEKKFYLSTYTGEIGDGGELTLTDAEYTALSTLHNKELTDYIRPYMDKVLQDFDTNDGQEIKDKTDEDAKGFFLDNPHLDENWERFTMQVCNEITAHTSNNQYYTPQQCFKELLVAVTGKKDKVLYDEELICKLLITLFKASVKTGEDCKDQSELYRFTIKLNYIKSKIRESIQSQELYDSPVQKALDYIEPLFDNRDFVLPYNKTSVKQLIHKIITSQQLLYLDIVKPNGFKGGFNLTLVYNIIGYLRSDKQHIIQGDGKNIDKFLATKYYAEDKIPERKHYINDFNDKKYYLRPNKELIDSIIEEHKSGNKPL